MVTLVALAPHEDFSGAPGNVPQFQSDHFARPQAEAGKEEQDGVISPSRRCGQVAGRQNHFHVPGRQVGWHGGQFPFLEAGDPE